MALGAERGDIVRMVIRQGFRLGGLGIALGALGSWGLIHVLRSELTEAQLRQVGLTSVDTFTCVAVVAFLALVSVAANYLPARRATKVDPMTALRYE
jgi:ABC-type antimicrobial peptide transport system permease subunit